ncbi:MAG: O-methyltransferase [Jiangellaceae bacterium]
MSRILAVGLVGWTILAGAFVVWRQPSPAVAVVVFLQGFVLLGLVYAIVGIRTANTRLARLYSATTASERAATAARLSLQGEIGDAAGRNRVDLGTDIRVESNRVVSTLSKSIQASDRHLFGQIEALTNLNAMMPFDRPMPATRGYPASPDLILLLVDLVRQVRPSLVVECGSGTSTLWFARALRHYGIDGRVVALEHERQYAEQTRQYLRDHDLADVADVREAPLETFVLGETEWRWYGARAWKDLDEVDLLFVDGPPADTAERAQFPALPLLADRLSRRAVIVVDDLVREDEREIVADWLAAYPEYSAENLSLEAGGAILRRTTAVSTTEPPRST